ncbi:PAS domain S-box-containing protein/diguanylate cyclase (GGDEF)-like protein [Lysobacter ruishenii]|uniref:PAS domain S-box-containing protein/diguanylate cyclase (GGDEF)-like protein n=2 Tax=Aerolutibacter ruishenii TaxID=686800 RepID=A0A562LRN6_9GAMM|nr:PAS domain S-box-containing protein/diguanylate cyclase (GGDEF)-like protein [Lysobacter ruishenii]
MKPTHESGRWVSVPAPLPPYSSRWPYAITVLLLLTAGTLLALGETAAFNVPVPRYAGWHILAETLSISMTLLVAVAAWLRTGGSTGLKLAAAGFLSVAVLDLLHLVTYPGLSEWPHPRELDRALLFWFGARGGVALTFLAMLLPKRWHSFATWFFLPYAAAVAATGLWLLDLVPALYVPGQGLTWIKRASDLAISASYVGLALAVLRHPPQPVRPDVVACGLLVLAAGEALIVLYSAPGNMHNTVIHAYKVLGTAFFAFGILFTQLVRPYRQLQSATRAHADTAGRLAALVLGAPDGILIVDGDGRILAHNNAADQLFRAAPHELSALAIEDLVPSEHRSSHAHHRASQRASHRTRKMSPVPTLQAVRRNGSRFYADISLSPMVWDGERCTAAFIRDVSPRVEHMLHTDWLASHDELTRLPNRGALRREIEARLAAAQPGAVFMLDLDKLTRINNALGREMGDRLLCATSERLRDNARPGEYVARYAGDRFVLILQQVDAGLERCRELLALFREPFVLQPDLQVQVSATGGYCRLGEPAENGSQVLQHCEIAVAAAKGLGQRIVVEFNPALHTRSQRWLELASRMPKALEQGEFRLVYQPRMNLADGRTAGFEALLRWQSADGNIGPAEFIPVAEDTGFIVELGRWALRQAIDQMARWDSQSMSVSQVAVNLSVRQLADASLPDFLRDCLAVHRLSANRIELEITETAAMENLDWALPRLVQFDEIGVALALDDFGTGYSSLAYLQALPCSTLKIDIAFVRRLGTPSGDALVRAILAMARSLDKVTVAEGVETSLQHDWLREHGCDQGQGYLFARPLEAGEVGAFLIDQPAPLPTPT